MLIDCALAKIYVPKQKENYTHTQTHTPHLPDKMHTNVAFVG